VIRDRFSLVRFRARQRSGARALRAVFDDVFEQRPQLRLPAIAALVTVLTAALLLVTPPSVAGYRVGEVATQTVRAPRSVTFVSDVLTQKARDAAADAVPKAYRRDASVASQEVTALTQSLARIDRARQDSQLPRDAKLAVAQSELGTAIAPEAIDMTADEWSMLNKDLPDLLRTILTQDVRTEDLDQVKADAQKSFPPAWSTRVRRVAMEYLKRYIVANTSYDQQATEQAQQTARNNTPPVVVQVLANEVIVREGQAVTPDVAEKLRAEGLSSEGVDWKGAIAFVVWSALVAAMYVLYLARYQPDVWRDARRLSVAIAALLVGVAATRALVPGHTLLVYFIPYAAIGMCLSVLVGARTAAVTQVAVALHVGMMSGQVELFAYALAPALVGMATLGRGTTARDFAKASAFVALADLGVLASFLFASKSVDVLGVLQLFSSGIVDGVLSGLLAFAGIVALGHLARITTVFELRELADPNHPLLRQLLLRTPGTYHHALLVANLAERAAEMIGADSLVARVGAYYHDIGKMRNPSAFIENQAGEKNPHDELDPLVSAQIVAAHVRDGLALADRYGLPERIREMIPSHHGTMVVKYFFQQAQARGEISDVDAYRYPGPTPHSREAGIVSLADGVEASVRSLPAKTPEEIRRMVDKIVEERLDEGQLDECDLTLADVQKIKAAFVELLVGVYHERIPYPEDRITPLPARTGTRR
jgi:putative nucleotidyltransferase with HDIG domain